MPSQDFYIDSDGVKRLRFPMKEKITTGTAEFPVCGGSIIYERKYLETGTVLRIELSARSALCRHRGRILFCVDTVGDRDLKSLITHNKSERERDEGFEDEITNIVEDETPEIASVSQTQFMRGRFFA